MPLWKEHSNGEIMKAFPLRSRRRQGRTLCTTLQQSTEILRAGAQSVVPRTTAAAPGNLLEIHILGPHLRPAKSEPIRAGSAICVLTSPKGDSDAHLSLRMTDTVWSWIYQFLLIVLSVLGLYILKLYFGDMWIRVAVFSWWIETFRKI